MVKKAAKCTVHSGNTLRATPLKKHTKLYHKQSFLVRQYALEKSAKLKPKDVDKKLFEVAVCENDVTYSLNQKGRWKLPSLLKAYIHSNESSKEIKSLLEHHKIDCRGDCVGYHTFNMSKGETTSITTKNSYSDERSISMNNDKAKHAKHRRKTHRKRTKENTENDETEPESTEPESTEPESTEPESTEPESTEPESTEPESTEPPIISQVYPCSQKSSRTHNMHKPEYMDCKDESTENGQTKRYTNRRVRCTTCTFLEVNKDKVSAEEYSEPEDDSDEAYCQASETCADEADSVDMNSWVYVDEDLSAEYPCSKKSSITQNPKNMDSKNDSAENGQRKRSKNRRVRHTTSSFLQMYEDGLSAEEYIEHEDDSDDDISADNSDLSPQNLYCSSQILDVLLDRAIKAKDVCKREKSSVHIFREPVSEASETCIDETDSVDMNSWVYVDEDLSADCYPNTKHPVTSNDSERETDVHVVGEHHNTMPTAHILISTEAVKPTSLRKQFGDKYLEAHCHPRKFGIDMTEEVTKICRKRKLISFTQKPWSWVVFTQDGSYDHDHHVFRVQLNSELGFNLPDLVTLYEMNDYKIEEVCQCVAIFVESCSADRIQMLPTITRATTSRPVLTFELLKSLKGWDRETYHCSQSHETTLTNSKQRCADVKEPSVPVWKRAEFCNICVTVIDHAVGVHHSNPATCLQLCEHWFCDSCWSEHLVSTIYSGLLSLKCPEFDCKTEVDHMTALTLMQSSEYKKLLQHCHDNKIQSESETFKWCPNPKCGRILKAVNRDWAATDKGMCVTCDCGLSVCFDCLGEAHWPASCQQAKDHRRKLVDLGHDKVNIRPDVELSLVVRFKYCPRCGEAITKDGGCRHMVCRCKFQFCWLCLQPIRFHPIHCKYRHQATVRKEFTHVDIRDRNLKFYSVAVRHMYYRRPRLLNIFREREKVLKAALKRWFKLQLSLSNDPSLSVLGIEGGEPALISHAVNEFISQIADLALEIHFVIENTAIVMQDENLGEKAPLVGKIIESMELIVNRINKIFDCKGDQDLRNVLGRLKELQTAAKTCLQSLTLLIADINVQEETWENKYIL